MKNIWKWILGGIIVLGALFALPFLFNMFGYGYGGMMGGYSGWGHPMMGGHIYSPFGGAFMGLGMLFVWAIPLGLLFLVVYGAIRLANRSVGSPAPTRACPNCGKTMQSDWNTCPYCGQTL